MSAENVTAAKEALQQVLEDVKNELGDTPGEKIAYKVYEGQTKKLISELNFLTEEFFTGVDEGPEEGDGGADR